MIVNVYYIAFELKEIEKNYKLFKYVYRKSHSVGIQFRPDNILYIACKTKEKRNEDYVMWKKYFNSTMLVFKEGIVNASCLSEEGKINGDLNKK